MSKTFLYVIGKEDGPVKVGISSAPQLRLSTIQTSCPFYVELLFATSFPTREKALRHEKIFHDVHEQDRAYGEWFNLDVELAVESIETAIDYANMDVAA